MTSVVVAPRVEDLMSDVEAVINGGQFRIRPSQAYVAGGQWVQPIWSAYINLTGTPVTVQLDPVTTPYELELMYPPDGGADPVVVREFRIVTSSGSPVAWETFTQVTGPAGVAVLTDPITARLNAQDAAIAAIGGSGASTLASITDMSASARTFNAINSTSAMLTNLGAATDSLAVHLAGTETLTGAKTINTLSAGAFTATTSATVPTPTAVGHATTKAYVDATVSSGTADATTTTKGKLQLAGDLAGTAAAPTVPALAAINATLTSLQSQITALTATVAGITIPDWSTLTGIPTNIAYLDGAGQLPLASMGPLTAIVIGGGGVTTPIRPSFAGTVIFWCATQPPTTGTTAGGTASMAPGDIWWGA